MNKLLLAVLCFWTLGATAQDKPSAPREVGIYAQDGKTLIGKVVVSAPGADLFLLKSVQNKDMLNHYLTTFYFGNKQTGPSADVRILLVFNKPVIAVTPSFSTAFNSVSGLAEDHLSYLFKAGRLDRDAASAVVISFAIESEEKIITRIDGLEGVLQ